MKKALLVLILVSATVFVWKLRSHDTPTEPTDSKLVLDRIWIDHIPRSDKDVFQVFVALTEQPVGIFQATSQWKGAYEMFRYESHGDEIRAFYPQTNEKDKIKTSAKACTDNGMDFCLVLDGASRGVKRYYSLKGWEIDHAATVADVRARVESLVHVSE